MADLFSSGLDITVVIRTYNSAHLILRALESVRVQTLQPQEIIVVDDLSTDDTVRIARQWAEESGLPLKVKSMLRHSGPAAARNKGIQQARSCYVALLDPEDEYFPNALECLIYPFSVAPELVLSFADRTDVTPVERQEHALFRPRVILERDADQPWGEQNLYRLRSPRDFLLKDSVIPVSATCFRRDKALSVGGMPEGFLAGETWLFWLRLSTQGEFAFQLCDVVMHHQHDDNLTQARKMELIARERMRGFDALRSGRLGIPLTQEQQKIVEKAFMNQLAAWRYHLSILGFPAYLAGLRNYRELLPGGVMRQLIRGQKSLFRAACYSLLQRRR